MHLRLRYLGDLVGMLHSRQMFEVLDMWTPTVEEEDYVALCSQLLHYTLPRMSVCRDPANLGVLGGPNGPKYESESDDSSTVDRPHPPASVRV